MDTNWIQWLILALVQGFTEFLPISSSAHLILASKFAGWQDQGLVMDIAAHFGSLLAVMWYFRKDMISILTGKNQHLFSFLIMATIPLVLGGMFFAELIETYMRTPLIIAIASAVFGVLLWLSQKVIVTENQIGRKHVLLMGLAQILALIPGASRSGVTLTAGMALGLNKSTAARFSFLMAIPAILMTTAYGIMKYLEAPQEYNGTGVLVITTVSFLSALLCIHWFLKIIEKINFAWFMGYRLALSVAIIWFLM